MNETLGHTSVQSLDYQRPQVTPTERAFAFQAVAYPLCVPPETRRRPNPFDRAAG
jgi:hypothetical protein